MRYRSVLNPIVFAFLIVFIAFPAFAQETVLTEIERLRPQELRVGGFELSEQQTVSIEAVGIRHRSRRADLRLSTAWILNAQNRQVVWDLRDADTDDLSDDLREYTGEVKLPAGRYEVYYASFPSHGSGDWDDVDGVGDFIGKLFDRDYDYRDYRKAAKKFKIVVHGRGKMLQESDLMAYHEELTKDAIVAWTQLDDERFEQIGFTVEKPLAVELYAVGEANKDGSYDYAWLIDAETRQTLWKLDYRDSDHAGGGKKNRMRRDEISLTAGKYALFCATDGSHHFDKWNTTPPYDPYFWGVTMQAKDPGMAKYVKLHEYKEEEEKNVVLQLTKMEVDEFRSEGFTLKKPTKVRVYAIGEGRSRDMADYSWIVDADSRETIWEFEYRRSDHAGGSSKNRMVDQVVELNKGDYMVYTITDGSHSYRDWNQDPPHDQEHWGVTIYSLNGKGNIVSYEEKADPSVLAQIVRVGDDDYERVRFQIDKRTDVHVYALGEGQHGKMADYAWIENSSTGKVVWEMTYRMTDHAGGAKKNRVYDDVLTLDPGEYTLFYESDGSHSFNHWNAKPPSDLWNWGVTVKKAKKGA